MEHWVCSFCGDVAVIHDTCFVMGEHYYFCNGCYSQYLGVREVVNPNLKVNARLMANPSLKEVLDARKVS